MIPLHFSVCAAGLDKPAATASRLASHGVKSLEIGPAFLADNDEGAIARVRDIFSAEQITVHSVHAPFRGTIQLSNPAGPERDAMLAFYESFLPRVAAIGAKVIIVHAGGPAAKAEHLGQVERATETLRFLAPLAGELGLRFALENLPPQWPGSNIQHLLAAMKELRGLPVGLCLDTGHAHMNENLIKAFKLMKPHLIAFHVHDNDGTEDLHQQPPYGTIDWEAFAREWDGYTFDGPLTLECSAWGDELLPKDRDEDFDFTRLLEGVREHFTHLNARLRLEKQMRREDPKARVRGACPHRGDLTF